MATKKTNIEVVSLVGVFRRAGLSFGAAPVVIDAASLSKAQLAALKAEPALKVTEVEVTDAKVADPAGAKA